MIGLREALGNLTVAPCAALRTAEAVRNAAQADAGHTCPACGGSGRLAPRAPVMDALLLHLAVRYGLEADDIAQQLGSRIPQVARAREEFCHLARARGKTWVQIARKLGMSDHTSAIDAERRWRMRLAAGEA